MFDAIADLNIVGDRASAAEHNTGFSAVTAEVVARADEIPSRRVGRFSAGIESNFISFLYEHGLFDLSPDEASQVWSVERDREASIKEKHQFCRV